MDNIQNLITNNLHIWSTALDEKKSGRGRGGANKGSIYGVKKLRELILDLAVRGKLVPQDPNDEPASELLKQIDNNRRQEKLKTNDSRIAKEGKVRNDELLFEMPRHWEVQSFENLFLFIDYRGHTPLKTTDGIRLITAKNIRNGFINYHPQEYISEELYYTWMTRGFPKEGDLFITTEAPLANVCVNTIEGKFAIAQRTICLQPYGKISTSFIMYSIMSNSIYKMIDKNATGMTARGIKAATLKTLPLPIPPLAEQHRIVAKVDELMKLCDDLEAGIIKSYDVHSQLVETLLKNLCSSQNNDDFNSTWQIIYNNFETLFTTEESIEKLKQSILQLAIMGKLVPQDPNDEPASELLKRIATEKQKLITEGKLKKEKPLPPITDAEKPFDLPKGWEWVRLVALTSLITKGSSPKWQGIDYTDSPDGVMFVTSENVGKYELLLSSPKYVEKTFNEIEPRSILNFGDFLMNIVGASIGRTAIYNKYEIANINQAVCLIRVIGDHLVDQFLLHFFNSETCLNYMFDKQVDNARPNLSMGNISQFVIPLPPLAEQHRIVAQVVELMELCDDLKSKITLANQTKITLANTLSQNIGV